MMKDEEFKDMVKKLHEEEKNNGIEGYERFKVKCVLQENALKKR